MKYSNLFYKLISCKDEDDVFEYLIRNLKETIISWDFFVAWEKVINKVEDIEISLNLLNYLVGKENITEKFAELVSKYPEVIDVLPVLVAWRAKNVKVLDPLDDNIFNYKEYSFEKKSSYTTEEIASLTEFADKTGLLAMFFSVSYYRFISSKQNIFCKSIPFFLLCFFCYYIVKPLRIV